MDGIFPQKPRQHDKVDTTGLQIRGHRPSRGKIVPFGSTGRGCLPLPRQYSIRPRAGIIADDKMDRYSGVIPEMGDDPGGIGTCS
jgi:hypothetical protein